MIQHLALRQKVSYDRNFVLVDISLKYCLNLEFG